MNSISNEKVELLRQNARSVVRELGLLNDAYFNIGVTLAERHLLIELSASLYPTVGEIAERLLLDKSTASRLITKAVKKGYIEHTQDVKDKRKRFLQLTQKGRETLTAFEPIAFDQTKNALLTLTEDEIDIVYKGIALYAKGLKHSRQRSKVRIDQIIPQDNPGLAHLLANDPKIQPQAHRKGEFIDLFNTYHRSGFSYLVMKMGSKIIGGAGISPYPTTDKTSSCELEKICLQSDMRAFGFEELLIEGLLNQIRALGYTQCYIDKGKEQLFSDKILQLSGFQCIKQGELWRWKVC